MTTFHLQIATMDGNVFDGQVQSVSCRTITETLPFWPAI